MYPEVAPACLAARSAMPASSLLMWALALSLKALAMACPRAADQHGSRCHAADMRQCHQHAVLVELVLVLAACSGLLCVS